MNKHTPGPWMADLASFKVCANKGKLEICRTYGDVRIAEEHANARLIAAAPDLLAVLSAIVSDYHALQRSQGASASLGAEFTAGEWIGSRLGGHIAQAESFLSKAKGEA